MWHCSVGTTFHQCLHLPNDAKGNSSERNWNMMEVFRGYQLEDKALDESWFQQEDYNCHSRRNNHSTCTEVSESESYGLA